MPRLPSLSFHTTTTHNVQNIHFTNEEDGTAAFHQNISLHPPNRVQGSDGVLHSRTMMNVEGKNRVDEMHANQVEEMHENQAEEMHANQVEEMHENQVEEMHQNRVEEMNEKSVEEMDENPTQRTLSKTTIPSSTLPSPKSHRITQILQTHPPSLPSYPPSKLVKFLHRHLWPLYDLTPSALDLSPSPRATELHSAVIRIWEMLEQDFWAALCMTQYSGRFTRKNGMMGEGLRVVPVRDEEVLLRRLKDMELRTGEKKVVGGWWFRREAAIQTLREFLHDEIRPSWRLWRMEDGVAKEGMYDGDGNLQFAGGHPRIVGVWVALYLKRVGELEKGWVRRWEWGDLLALGVWGELREDFWWGRQ